MLALLVFTAIAVNADLEAGHGSYERLRYEQALQQFTQSLSSAGTTAERVDAYLYIGMCRFELGDEQGGRFAFRQALGMDRAAQLSPLASPKIEAAFADERARMGIIETPPVTVAAPVEVPQHVTTTVPPPTVTGHPHWPSIAAGAVAVGTLTAAILVGASAKSRHDDSVNAQFASDAQRLNASAHSRAHAANALYGIAGALAAFGIVYEVAF